MIADMYRCKYCGKFLDNERNENIGTETINIRKDNKIYFHIRCKKYREMIRLNDQKMMRSLSEQLKRQAAEIK